jgi:hypothetical protein
MMIHTCTQACRQRFVWGRATRLIAYSVYIMSVQMQACVLL